MDNLDAILLGIVQGLTEFLPVSSSGHLELGKALLGDSSVPEESLLFTVMVHGATALSTIVIFRKEIAEILLGLLSFKNNEAFRFSVKIILSMIPAALVGFFLETQLEQLFGGKIAFVGAMLMVTALLLWLADRAKNTGKPVSFKDAVIVGIAQAVAILPGVSRSGATISTAVLLGIDKGRAARFSFLMVVPLILGKIAKDLLDGSLSTDTTNLQVVLLGFATAFISGLVACKWMLSLVRNSKLTGFAIYCLVVGMAALLIGLFV